MISMASRLTLKSPHAHGRFCSRVVHVGCSEIMSRRTVSQSYVVSSQKLSPVLTKHQNDIPARRFYRMDELSESASKLGGAAPSACTPRSNRTSACLCQRRDLRRHPVKECRRLHNDVRLSLCPPATMTQLRSGNAKRWHILLHFHT